MTNRRVGGTQIGTGVDAGVGGPEPTSPITNSDLALMRWQAAAGTGGARWVLGQIRTT